jgi:hypothetical protein
VLLHADLLDIISHVADFLALEHRHQSYVTFSDSTRVLGAPPDAADVLEANVHNDAPKWLTPNAKYFVAFFTNFYHNTIEICKQQFNHIK